MEDRSVWEDSEDKYVLDKILGGDEVEYKPAKVHSVGVLDTINRPLKSSRAEQIREVVEYLTVGNAH